MPETWLSSGAEIPPEVGGMELLCLTKSETEKKE